MGPITAEVEVDAPRERAFELLADLALRPTFTDHFVTDFHLTRIEPRGVGAGARFRLALWPRSIWMDTTVVESEPPHKVVERGFGGRGNRIPTRTVWEVLEGAGPLTLLRVSLWTEPSNPVDIALEKLSGAAMRLERDLREAMRRAREILESEAPPGKRVGVAGGNAHATGIP
ncbi:MAG TPA: SRPBCC family protein [Solirubrobacterales bacterium]|jgi:hypothetical protein